MKNQRHDNLMRVSTMSDLKSMSVDGLSPLEGSDRTELRRAPMICGRNGKNPAAERILQPGYR